MNTHATEGESAACIEAGANAAGIEDRTMGLGAEGLEKAVPLILLQSNQKLEVPKQAIDLFDQRQPAPRYRHGNSTHHEVGSFIEHVKRYKSETTVVWADVNDCDVVAVYDYTPAGPTGAAWMRHTASYAAPYSQEWKRWFNRANEVMSQDDFAEFLENEAERIQGDVSKGWPSSVELLEMARDLRIYTKGQFERRVDPVTGQYALVCKEEHESHSTKIHREFRVWLRVFQGGDAYSVLARVKFRLEGGRVTFVYELPRAEEIVANAFGGVVEKVKTETGCPVFMGASE